MRKLITILYLILLSIPVIPLTLTEYYINELNLQVPLIIEDNNDINAYTDGYKIVLYTGLLNLPEANLESISLVIMHELGHIRHYHSWKRKIVINQALMGIETNCKISEGNYDTFCVDNYEVQILQVFKIHEYEADDYAYNYGIAHNYNPQQACSIYKLFATVDTNLDDSHSTHPASITRYNRCIESLSSKVNL